MDEYDYLYSHFESSEKVSVSSFSTIKIIGKGTYGEVVLVKKRDNGKIFAMKIVKKKVVEFRSQKDNIRSERNILVSCLF